MNASVSSPLLAHIKRDGSHIEAMMSSEETRVSGIQNIMNQLLKIMQLEISENRTKQDQFLQMKELVHGLVQSMQDRKASQSVNLQQLEQDILDKQQQILWVQKQNVDRLVTIQECVQDAAALAFALHEHSVPRLFVVLPRVAAHPNQRGVLLPDQFRLFFLCECGRQSRPEGRTPSRNIHMARHEGYDLENAKEFFDNYSLYLLSIIHILRNGINAPGINISSVSHLRLAEGVQEVQGVLDLASNTIQSLLNETISFIREQRPDYPLSRVNSQVILLILESTDLKSVVRYLKGYDKQLGHAPGNLRQTLMPGGDVEWACTDHYIERQIEVVVRPQETDTLGVDREDIKELARLMAVQRQDKIMDMKVLLALQDTRWIVREKAIGTCQGRAELDENILRALIEAVRDEHWSVREAAVRILGGPSKVSHAALQAVIIAVKDVMSGKRRWMYWQAIPELRPYSGAWLESRSMNAMHRKRWDSATFALQRQAQLPGFKALVASLQDEEETVQAAAVQELTGKAGLPQSAIQSLIWMLIHVCLNVREAAAKVLEGQEGLSVVSVEALAANLSNGDPNVREVVVRALGGQDETPGVRGAAIHALECEGELPEYAVQALIEALIGRKSGSPGKGNPGIRRFQALSNNVALSKGTTKALINNLADERWYVREASVRILSGHDERSVAVAVALVGVVLDENASVREAVVRALASELPEESIQTLLEDLQNEDWETKEAALRVVGAQDNTLRVVIESLITSLREKNFEATKSDESSNRPSGSDDLSPPTTRITSERTSTGEIRYLIVGQYNGNVIRTKFDAGTGEFIHIPHRESEGELRYVYEERTETGEIRKVIGSVITGNVSTSTKLSIIRYEDDDAENAVPSAAIGTVVFSKFRILAPSDIDIEDTTYTHVEEVKAPNTRRTIKWMKSESRWKHEAGMLQHLKSDRYISDLFTLYSLPSFAEYRCVSILGSFSRTLESYMKTKKLSLRELRQLTASLSDALRWCHDNGVVHLNVCTASFYLDGVPGQDASDGNGQLVWKLWNFSQACLVGEFVDNSITTVMYTAPEILRQDANAMAAVSMDLWSLGLILYELYTGRPYFTSASFAEFQLTQTEFEFAMPTVKDWYTDQTIKGLLAVDPEKRFTHDDLRVFYLRKI
ncbi:hypothetical protein BGZ65_007151 [Modicella reniformis]|uniref:non-specific serine/threonine protein kinase n=1 Tax=Modicella reniformis TaxID=1440133 RepID=A0A9P6MB95_9FUNG|nr:hypothetical protein BGZ65_007151 [Modicella reniformis]